MAEWSWITVIPCPNTQLQLSKRKQKGGRKTSSDQTRNATNISKGRPGRGWGERIWHDLEVPVPTPPTPLEHYWRGQNNETFH